MPLPMIKSLAEKSEKSVGEVESLWREAKKIAFETFEKSTEEFYPYSVGILKKMLGIETARTFYVKDLIDKVVSNISNEDFQELAESFPNVQIKDNTMAVLIENGTIFSTFLFDLNKFKELDYSRIYDEIESWIENGKTESESVPQYLDTASKAFIGQEGEIRNGVPYVEITADLPEKLKKKGIGSLLYGTLLNKFGSFLSDYTVSKSARNVYLSGLVKGNVELVQIAENIVPITNFNFKFNTHSELLRNLVKGDLSKDSEVRFRFHKKPNKNRIKAVNNIDAVLKYVNDYREKKGKPIIKLDLLKKPVKDLTKKSPDWWESKTYKQQKQYLKERPNSRMKITKSP